jgi:hypothetical protein
MRISFSNQGTSLSCPDLNRMPVRLAARGTAFEFVVRAAGVLAVLLVMCPFSKSQQSSSSGATAMQDSEPSSPQGPPNVAGSEGPFVRALGSASELIGDQGLFQWGWVSLRSFTVLELVGQQTLDAPLGEPQPPSQSGSLTQLTALIVLDRQFKKARLTLQYQPAAFITNGNFYANAANQSSSLNTNFRLNERWGLAIGDSFNYYATQRVYAGFTMDANYISGTTFLNNYTSGPGSALTNNVGVSASYQWSPRTTLSFGPNFGYEYATGSESGTSQAVSALSTGGNVILTHQLTEQVTLGATYVVLGTLFSNSSKIAGPQEPSVIQQDFNFTYSQQFTPTLWVNAALGVLSSPNYGGTGLSVHAGLTKAFLRNRLAVNYDRGLQFNGLITGYASDRIDAVHSINWTPRFSTSTSAAYFRYLTGQANTQSGFYATEQVNYRLANPLSVFGGFSYTKQVGDSVYLLSGQLHFFTFGLIWSPAVARP